MGSRAGDAQPEATAGQFLVQLLQNPRHHQSSSPLDHAVSTSSLGPPHPRPQNPNPNGFNQLHPHIGRIENSKERISQVGNVYRSCSSNLGSGEGFSGSDIKFKSYFDGNRMFSDNSLNWKDNVEGRISKVGNVDGFSGSSSSSSKGRFDLGNGGGFSGQDIKPNQTKPSLIPPSGVRGSDIKFENSFQWNRSVPGNVGGLRGGELEGVSESDTKFGNVFNANWNVRGNVEGWGGSNGLGKQGHGGRYSAVVPPTGFGSKTGFGGNRDNGGNRWSNLDNCRSNVGMMSGREADSNGKDGGEGPSTNKNWKYNNGQNGRVPSSRLENPRFNSVPFNEFEESLIKLHAEEYQKMKESGNYSKGELDNLVDQLASSLLDEGSEGWNTKEKAKGSRDKDYRSDKRGQRMLAQRIRIMKRQAACCRDIDSLNDPFLAIYKSLIPPEEEKKKQEKLLAILGSLMKKELPEAQLYVYGSCANSFGFSKSDIDICLVIKNMDINRSEVLLKLAETLELNNFQNVQALTHARVPIVKLMDPYTGISCDICINNILAVINTKLLRDYARIDGRVRQLAFIVKHWAKRRGVNETYRGTLSSYAYVLMCINYLQQRKPAILPCLQGMEPTYSVTVENTECAYFNEVDKLYGFGARNGETIANLVWGFFNYWAYYHDYTNDVISVRTGRTLSKHAKDWTRRIGNDRHLICIEDPFATTHDLGRVVDKASIRVLREEFERAAQIMQDDSDPCTHLFEPYIPA